MKTITNVSNVTDNSGETPVITYSNPVTTVIRRPAKNPIIRRVFYNLQCGCCECNCCQNCCCCLND